MFLKQSTAVTIKMGPFVDDTDGKTAETGLTISQADVRLSKNGGDFAQKNESSAATHDESGYYDVDLDATDTATVGRLKVAVSESGALPVKETFFVLDALTWAALFTDTPSAVGTDGLLLISTDQQDVSTSFHVNTKRISNNTAAADAVEANIGNLDAPVSTVDTVVDAIKAKTDNLPNGVPKNTALNNFMLIMRDTDGDPATGKTVTAQRSIDGAAFGACANSVSEIANGAYKINLAAADLNGDTIMLYFTAAGCDPVFVEVKTNS